MFSSCVRPIFMSMQVDICFVHVHGIVPYTLLSLTRTIICYVCIQIPGCDVAAHDTRPLFMNMKGGTHHVHLCLVVLRPSEARFMSAHWCRRYGPFINNGVGNMTTEYIFARWWTITLHFELTMACSCSRNWFESAV